MSGSKWATQSDDALMQAAIAGDDAAFEALAFRLHPRLVRFCAKFTSKYDEADDLAQETLIRLWGARGRYSANAPLLAFVLTIARKCLFAECARSEPSRASNRFER